MLAVWSARDDRKFEQRLRYAGFTVEVERVRGRLKKGGPRHTIFVAHRHELAEASGPRARGSGLRAGQRHQGLVRRKPRS